MKHNKFIFIIQPPMDTFSTSIYPSPPSQVTKPQSSISMHSAEQSNLKQSVPFSLTLNNSPLTKGLTFKQQKLVRRIRSPPSINEESRSPKIKKNQIHLLMRMNTIRSTHFENEADYQQIRKPLIVADSRQTLKPKIYFSYNGYESKDSNTKSMTLNSPQALLDYTRATTSSELKQFQRRFQKNQKIKKMKINSSVFYFLYIPKNQHKIQIEQSFIHQLRSKNHHDLLGSSTSINTISYIQNQPEQYCKQAKSSKMASTEITQSFSIDSRKFDFSSTKETEPLRGLQKYDESNHRSAKNIFSYQHNVPSLLESLQSSKNLNKTLIQNNYNFGGIFVHQPSPNPSSNMKMATQADIKEQANPIWKTLMSGLFHEQASDENLKRSIYCGPEKRHQSLRCDILSGFGRELASSKVCPDQ